MLGRGIAKHMQAVLALSSGHVAKDSDDAYVLNVNDCA